MSQKKFNVRFKYANLYEHVLPQIIDEDFA